MKKLYIYILHYTFIPTFTISKIESKISPSFCITFCLPLDLINLFSMIVLFVNSII